MTSTTLLLAFLLLLLGGSWGTTFYAMWLCQGRDQRQSLSLSVVWLMLCLQFSRCVRIQDEGPRRGDLSHSKAAEEENKCEEGWQSVHRGCHRFEKERKLDWQGAQSECRTLNSDLTSISDLKEMNKMKAFLKNDTETWWIGLKRGSDGKAWVWLDGGIFQNRITRWKKGEPNNDGKKENCVEVDEKGQINDKECSTLRAFICEKHEITARPLDQKTFPITATPTTTTTTATTTTDSAIDISPSTSPPVNPRYSKISPSTTTSQSLLKPTKLDIDNEDTEEEKENGDDGEIQTPETKENVDKDKPEEGDKTTRPPTTSQNYGDNEEKKEAEVNLYELYSGCFLLDLPGRRDVNRPFLYTVGARTCPSLTASHVRWPETAHDTRQSAPCRGNSEGNIFFYCGGNPTCWRGVPDVDQCASRKFRDILKKISVPQNVSEPPKPEVTVAVTTELARVTDSDDITEEDIAATSKVIQSLVSSGAASNFQEQKVVKDIVANVVRAGSNLVSANKTRVWAHMGGQDKIRSATALLVAMETATVAMAEEIDEPTTYVTKDENIELELRVVNVTASAAGQEKQAITYSAENSDNQFSIPLHTLSHLSKGGLAKVIFMTHYTMGDILEDTDDDTSDDHRVSTTDEEVDVADDDKQKIPPPRLASYILSASVGGHQHPVQLPEPISFTMRHIKRVPEGYHSLCSFWSIADSGLGEWSQNGCLVVRSNANQTTCQCDHMTNFAVLMAVQEVQLSEVHVSMLRLVTIVGCIISCLCLLASWVTFTCFTSLQGERNSIHKNLVVCLFIAEMLFLTGIDQIQNRLACGIIAGCLHYFFLAAFLWMLLEGVQIVLMLVQVFDASKSRLPYYYAAAYSPPALIVAISTGFYHQGYGTEKYCWLTTERNFIWSFAGPVAAILCINTIILIYALTMVCRHSEYVFSGKEKTTAGGIRSWIQGALALEVLLGLTWILGFFFISQQSVAVAYVFTVLNATQGLFIFIFHCLLNKKARKEYHRVIGVKRRPSTTTGSGSGTHSASLGKNKLTSGHSFNRNNHSLDNPTLNFYSHA